MALRKKSWTAKMLDGRAPEVRVLHENNGKRTRGKAKMISG